MAFENLQPVPSSSSSRPKVISDPFDHLPVLLSRVRRLIRETDHGRGILSDADTIIQKLKEVHRSLSVLNLVHNRYLIAVAGPQGAGKTSAMKWLYGIPDAYLPINATTGERLPVMLVEHEEDTFKAFVHQYDVESGVIERTSVSAATCKETAMSPGPDDIIVELAVPPRFFGEPNVGFLLLAGVERSTSTHVILAQQVVPSAATALICVDDGLVSRGSVKDEVKRIREEIQQGSEAQILYALTKPRGGEHTEQTVETLKERFDISDERRVVVITAPETEEEYSPPTWRDPLRDGVARYADLPATQRRAQVKALRRGIRALEDKIGALESQLELHHADLQEKDYGEVKPLLREFDEAVHDQRKSLEKALKKELELHAKEAQRAADSYIVERGLLEKLKRPFASPVKKRKTVEDRIHETWESASPEGPKLPVLNGLESTIKKSLLPHEENSSKAPQEGAAKESGLRRSPPEIDMGPVEDSTGSNGESESESNLKETVIRDVHALMIEGSDNTLSDNFRTNIQAIPALGLEAVRIAYASETGVGVTPDGTVTIDREAAPDLFKKVEETRESGKGVLKGVLIMLGMDVAPDAELDILKDLGGAVGVPAGNPALAAAVLALGVGYVAFSVHKMVQEEDLNESEVMGRVLGRIAERTKLNVLGTYDEYMYVIRKRIKNNLHSRLNLDAGFSDHFNMLRLKGDVQSATRDIRRALPSHY